MFRIMKYFIRTAVLAVWCAIGMLLLRPSALRADTASCGAGACFCSVSNTFCFCSTLAGSCFAGCLFGGGDAQCWAEE